MRRINFAPCARRARFCDYCSACSLLRRARWKLKWALVTSLERSSMHMETRRTVSFNDVCRELFLAPVLYASRLQESKSSWNENCTRGPLSFIEENGMNSFTATHIPQLKLANSEIRALCRCGSMHVVVHQIVLKTNCCQKKYFLEDTFFLQKFFNNFLSVISSK